MKLLPRRAVLGAGAVTAIAGATSQAALEQAVASGPIGAVSDRRALATMQAEPGTLAYLDEIGRAGLFRCVPSSTAKAIDDPLQGLFVPAALSNQIWARVWDETHGRPEWFGAKPADGAADCADALEACHRLCPVTVLGQTDYFVRRTVRLANSWRTLRGNGRYATALGQGTRIILHRDAPGVTTDDILLMGTAVKPAGELLTESHVSDVTLARDGPSRPHPSGDPARYPAGLRCAYLAHCTVTGVASLENSVGFCIGGVVYTKIDDCLAQRTRAGAAGGVDKAIGFLLDGRVRFGYPGGNASLYMDRCVAAEQHARHVEPTGLLALGAFVDSFIDRFESARIDTGMTFRAAGARGFGETIDLHVRNPVLDGCGRFGLDLDLDATASACVEIVDPYVTSAGGRGDRGILVRDGAGLVTITGGQVLGDFAGGSLFVSRTRGVRVQGLKIAQSTRPVVIADADGVQLEPQISNWEKQATHPAIAARNLSRAAVRPTIIGYGPPSFPAGIELDAKCHHLTVDGSAIDPACLTDGAAGKVRFAEADARRNSAFAAAGNVLSGVVD